MLKINGDVIDRTYIAGWANRTGLTDIWTAILAQVDARPTDDDPLPF